MTDEELEEQIQAFAKARSGYHAPLVLDHIVSRRNGGTNDPANIQTLCDSCNSEKSGLVDTPRGRRGEN